MMATNHCRDCGFDYQYTEDEHNLVCEARTCETCLITHYAVIPFNQAGHRICGVCLERMSDDDGATQATTTT